ncbi:MAG: hypothetical protein ABI364_01320 [Caldimonas sp.]
MSDLIDDITGTIGNLRSSDDIAAAFASVVFCIGTVSLFALVLAGAF